MSRMESLQEELTTIIKSLETLQIKKKGENSKYWQGAHFGWKIHAGKLYMEIPASFYHIHVHLKIFLPKLK